MQGLAYACYTSTSLLDTFRRRFAMEVGSWTYYHLADEAVHSEEEISDQPQLDPSNRDLGATVCFPGSPLMINGTLCVSILRNEPK